ncbi:MAG: hypothetical protein PHD48_09390 [Alphaproteobacteria bacterium]|nr:hypothetical protein [Alphaproteobacteria bacterium]
MVDPATRVATAILYATDKTSDFYGVKACIGIIRENIVKLTDPKDQVNARAAAYHMARTCKCDDVAISILQDHYRSGHRVGEVQQHAACKL